MENLLTSLQGRVFLLLVFVGLIFIASGIFFFKSGPLVPQTKVEVLGESQTSADTKNITAEIAGEVARPGVYKLSSGSRVDDLLNIAGGFSKKADTAWTDKYLNRASKITDGQKIFVPAIGQQSGASTAKESGGNQTVSSGFSSDSNTPININTASLDQLDALPGIGQVYGQSIIEHRPYSTVEELVSKGAINQSLLNKIKEKISVY